MADFLILDTCGEHLWTLVGNFAFWAPVADSGH